MSTHPSAGPGPAPSTMRVFTRALRVPSLVGKLPGGGHLPFGPYTMTQFVGGALVLVVGLSRADAVLPWGWLVNRGVVLAVAAAVVLVLGLVKPGGRDPLSAVLGVLDVYGAPRAGRSGGRPIRVRRPHQVRHRIGADVPDWQQATAATAAPSTPASATRSEPDQRNDQGADQGTYPGAGPVALSGVGQLLAQAATATYRQRHDCTGHPGAGT